MSRQTANNERVLKQTTTAFVAVAFVAGAQSVEQRTAFVHSCIAGRDSSVYHTVPQCAELAAFGNATTFNTSREGSDHQQIKAGQGQDKNNNLSSDS